MSLLPSGGTGCFIFDESILAGLRQANNLTDKDYRSGVGHGTSD